MEKPILQDSPSFVDLCTLHQHAMRYYRLWIYACNTVLALATLVFTVFAVSVLVDPRISLLSGVELYQPTFLYAYVALLLQCGVLQAIGCVGALKLNQRLLNTYWTLLLVLMIGDILVGLVWAFRLDQIKSNLRPMLKQKLVAFYGKDPDFTEVWDWVQTNDMCCGVDGPIDFQQINESTFGTFDTNGLANDTWATYLLQQQNQQSIPKLPSTCCIFEVIPVTTPEPPSSDSGGGGDSRGVEKSSERGANTRRSHNGYKSSRGSGPSSSKGDRWNANDPINSKQVPSGYYQQPQYLKGSFHTTSSSGFPETARNNGTSSSSSSLDNDNLVVSNLRQLPLTDQVSPSALGYFGPGTGALPPPNHHPTGTHNRRRISHQKNKHLDEYGYAERTRWGGRPPPPMTTTEGPPSGRPSPATIGVCVLPSHLRQTPPHHPSTSSSSDSMESASASFEDSGSSSEFFSTSTIHPSLFSSSTSTPPPESAYTSSSEPASSSSPPSSPRSSPSPSSKGSSSNSGRAHFPFPFTVSQKHLHGDGCGDKILEWVEHSSDVLFVIGFCIIVFLKGCFIAILRYEIKEMIEKIKLLNGEDAGRTAAMNELIGLTSMYESGNDDSGEREGLMAGVHGTNADTSNTNVDTPDETGTRASSPRKDSIHYVKENHLIGNNVAGVGIVGGNLPPSRYIGNHVEMRLPPAQGGNDDYPRVLAVTRESFSSPSVANRHDIEEDFDSGSALLGYKHNSNCTNESPIENNKHHQHHHHHHHHHHHPHILQHQESFPHRNENGGRNLPRNGNNNQTTLENTPPSSCTTSVVAPLPIDAIARVTNSPIH